MHPNLKKTTFKYELCIILIMKKKLLFLLILIFSLLILMGCTQQTPLCGDGICEQGENDPSSRFYCPQDCSMLEQRGVLEIGVYDSVTRIGIDQTQVLFQKVLPNQSCSIDLTQEVEYLTTDSKGRAIDNFSSGKYALDFIAMGYDNDTVICVDIYANQVTSIDYFLEKVRNKTLCDNTSSNQIVLGHTEEIIVNSIFGEKINFKVGELFYNRNIGNWENRHGAMFRLLFDQSEIGFIKQNPGVNLTNELSGFIELEENITYVSNCWETQESISHKIVLEIN